MPGRAGAPGLGRSVRRGELTLARWRGVPYDVILTGLSKLKMDLCFHLRAERAGCSPFQVWGVKERKESD